MVPNRIGHRRIARSLSVVVARPTNLNTRGRTDHSRDRQDDENDTRQREQEGGGVEAHQAALLVIYHA